MKNSSFLTKLFSGFKKPDSDTPDSKREYTAEELEGRILYSGAPATIDLDLPPLTSQYASSQEEVDFQSANDFDNGIGFSTDPEERDDDVILSNLVNLTDNEIESLAELTIDRGKDADLDEDQEEILRVVEISLMDISSLADRTDFISDADEDDISDDLFGPIGTSTMVESTEPNEESRLGLEYVADLLKEVNGPVRVVDLAVAQVAKRSIEVDKENQPVTRSSLDLSEDGPGNVWLRNGVKKAQKAEMDTTEYQVVELEGASLGYAEGSAIFFDEDTPYPPEIVS